METMAIFDDMLKDSESLFMDPVVLDYDYLPKLIPYREKEQKHVAFCIKPLFVNRNEFLGFQFTNPFSFNLCNILDTEDGLTFKHSEISKLETQPPLFLLEMI